MSESLRNLFAHPWCIPASGRLLCKKRQDIISFPHRQQFSVPRAQHPEVLQPFCTYPGQDRGTNPGPSEQDCSNCMQLGGLRRCCFSPLLELHPIKVMHKPSLPALQGSTRLPNCNTPLSTSFSCSSASKPHLKAQWRILKSLVLICLPQPSSQRPAEKRSS